MNRIHRNHTFTVKAGQLKLYSIPKNSNRNHLNYRGKSVHK